MLRTGESRSPIKPGKAVLDFFTNAEKLSV